jgi:hypothetical protein
MKMTPKMKKFLRQYLVYGIFLLLLIIALGGMQKKVFSVFVILGLIVIASLSKIYKQFTYISFGFELVTPVVIIFAYKLGIVFTIISALFMVFASEFISGKMNMIAAVIQVVIYIILSLLGGLMSGLPFVSVAIFLVVLRNILLFVGITWLGSLDIIRTIMSTVPNILINGFILVKIGNIILSLL